jgi:hypothetical protein
MRCLKHRKTTIGSCQWCGNQLCPHCVNKKEGRKIYCEKCVIRLSGVRRAKVPPPQQIKAQEKKDIIQERRQQHTGDKKYTIDKDGYLILEQ